MCACKLIIEVEDANEDRQLRSVWQVTNRLASNLANLLITEASAEIRGLHKL